MGNVQGTSKICQKSKFGQTPVACGGADPRNFKNKFKKIVKTAGGIAFFMFIGYTNIF